MIHILNAYLDLLTLKEEEVWSPIILRADRRPQSARRLALVVIFVPCAVWSLGERDVVTEIQSSAVLNNCIEFVSELGALGGVAVGGEVENWIDGHVSVEFSAIDASALQLHREDVRSVSYKLLSVFISCGVLALVAAISFDGLHHVFL